MVYDGLTDQGLLTSASTPVLRHNTTDLVLTAVECIHRTYLQGSAWVPA